MYLENTRVPARLPALNSVTDDCTKECTLVCQFFGQVDSLHLLEVRSYTAHNVRHDLGILRLPVVIGQVSVHKGVFEQALHHGNTIPWTWAVKPKLLWNELSNPWWSFLRTPQIYMFMRNPFLPYSLFLSVGFIAGTSACSFPLPLAFSFFCTALLLDFFDLLLQHLIYILHHSSCTLRSFRFLCEIDLGGWLRIWCTTACSSHVDRFL